MTNYDEPTIGKQQLIDIATDRLNHAEAWKILGELGIVETKPTGSVRVNIDLAEAPLHFGAHWWSSSKLRLARFLSDNTDKIVNFAVEPVKAQPDPNLGTVEKSKVLEVALKYRKSNSWCTDGFREAMAELGIRLPPQRVYRVSFDILEDEMLEFANSDTVNSFNVSSASSYLDEVETSEVANFTIEATDRMEAPNVAA